MSDWEVALLENYRRAETAGVSRWHELAAIYPGPRIPWKEGIES